MWKGVEEIRPSQQRLRAPQMFRMLVQSSLSSLQESRRDVRMGRPINDTCQVSETKLQEADVACCTALCQNAIGRNAMLYWSQSQITLPSRTKNLNHYESALTTGQERPAGYDSKKLQAFLLKKHDLSHYQQHHGSRPTCQSLQSSEEALKATHSYNFVVLEADAPENGIKIVFRDSRALLGVEYFQRDTVR
ncbi:hypothetical protein M427DRAFT_49302 [Gonapodya prolifera JEL478]|uniref:Uncharacterized protein n=1 Tax=Gonapodya prolifera (strain JEL478) TaxID=1344416 RepID=A0A138ZZV5_GONPJ|nr:hypothetical protein M427DRAFT_49302 [Gonapodya prolifera JEL478]|eukprot:KXS09673.1 hypothetical protein M427DRAFT_49302 [Gonapodya prolifera JEL478]